MHEMLCRYIREHFPQTVKPACEDNDTLIGLPFPYTTPCVSGMFQELYYWDTYFTNVGLLLSGMTEQAKHNVNNMISLIRRYGKMPNGNRTYYLNRSQPPFLSQMVRELFDITHDLTWLSEDAYPALEKEYRFWTSHRGGKYGLNRYGCDLKNDADYLDIASCFSERIQQPLPDDHAARIAWGKSMMALCESGWDCTSRFALDAHEHLPADLNALLYLAETNMAYFAKALNRADEITVWNKRADARREAMTAFLWSEERQVFCDRSIATDKLNLTVSAAAFYPMFVGAATPAQAAQTVNALPLLEHPHGIACCEMRDGLLNLQWDHPHGWACLHYIVICGLLRYGYKEDAKRIASKYTDTVAKNFALTGNLWEKYNVTDGTVSAAIEYDTPPMMGWTAGVFLYCEQLLSE